MNHPGNSCYESSAQNAGRAVLNSARLLLLTALLLCEPIVRWVCATAMILGIVVCVLFEVSAAGPQFPFLAMFALSISFGVALVLYEGLIALLSS